MAKFLFSISGIIGLDETATADYVRQKLSEAAGAPLDYTVSSPGGIIYEGLEIFNLINDYSGETTSKLIGMAASMASVIPLAANKRIAKSNAVLMIHDALLPIFGNPADHRKAADILDGLSNILAEIYAQASGKSIDELRVLMGDETYFFGKSIAENGFVDEIEEIKTAIPTTEAKAILDAKAQIALCIDRVNSKIDITKAAAILTNSPISFKKSKNTDDDSSINSPEPPANQNNGEKTMDFKQFLAFLETKPEAKAAFEAYIAENRVDFEKISLTDLLAKCPVAKKEHETAVAAARTEVESGKLTKEQVSFVATAISSEAYGKSVKTSGIKVLTGEKDFSTFEDFVAQADEFSEKLKSLGIKQGQPGSTPGEDHNGDDLDAKKVIAQAHDHGKKIGTYKEEAK